MSFSRLLMRLIAPNTLPVTLSVRGIQNTLCALMPLTPSIAGSNVNSAKLFSRIGCPNVTTSLTKEGGEVSINSGRPDRGVYLCMYPGFSAHSRKRQIIATSNMSHRSLDMTCAATDCASRLAGHDETREKCLRINFTVSTASIEWRSTRT